VQRSRSSVSSAVVGYWKRFSITSVAPTATAVLSTLLP
jgi:hypothetical protein